MEQQMSRKDYFKKLQADKEAASKTFEGGGYENPEFIALSDTEYRLVRLLGNDFNSKEQCSTDPHIFKTMFIKGDDGKKIKVIVNPDRDHPFNKLVYFLGKGKWIEDENTGKKKKIYDHEGSSSLKIMNSNYNDDAQYVQSWDSPTKYIAINCLDRMDDWCATNKHTKVLVHSANENDGKVYPEIGIRKQAYDMIWEQLCTKYETHYEDFDIAIKRIPPPKDKKIKQTSYYDILRADRSEQDLIEFGEKAGIDYASRVGKSGIPTAEELLYARYDFEAMPCFLPTTAKRLYNHIAKFIKQVDAEFDTHYVEDFAEYIAKEEESRKAFWAEYNAKNKSDEESEDTNSKSETSKPEVKSETKEAPVARRVVKKEAPAFDLSTIDTSAYAGWDKLSDENKAMIIGQDENTGLLIFKPECQLVPCVNDADGCDIPSPDSFNICYACGAEFV